MLSTYAFLITLECITMIEIDALLKRATDPVEETQLQAARRIVQIGRRDPRVVPMVTRLFEGDIESRVVGAEIIGRIGRNATSAIPRLAELLLAPSEPTVVRSACASALGQLGPESTIPLGKALKTKDEEIQRNAAGALGRIAADDIRAVRLLVACLSDANNDVREVALEGLQRAYPKAQAELKRALKSSDPVTQAIVGEVLINSGYSGEDVYKQQVSLLASKLSDARYYAARSLGAGGKYTEWVLPPLIRRLEDTDKRVRYSAARSIGEMGTSAKLATAALIAATKDTDERVRGYACMALGRLRSGEPNVIAALSRCLTDDSPEVVIAAIHAIEVFGNAARAAIPWLKELAADEGFGPLAREAIKKISGEK